MKEARAIILTNACKFACKEGKYKVIQDISKASFSCITLCIQITYSATQNNGFKIVTFVRLMTT